MTATFVTPADVSPYALAGAYIDAGWAAPLPLPLREKHSPPAGYTGHNGREPSVADIARWQQAGPHNICLRLPDTVVGIDVDHYGDKRGADRLAEVAAEVGSPLPATWRSSSRDAPSGIYLFRVPPGLELVSDLGDSIEIIRPAHRYVVVWPSIHPASSLYRWYRPDGIEADRPPRPDELPQLNVAWVARLRDVRPKAEPAANPPPAPHHEASWAPCVEQAHRRAVDDLASPRSRHDAATAGACALARLESQGHAGASAAMDDLGARFRAAVTSTVAGKAERTPTAAAREWQDIVNSGRDRVATTAASTPTVAEQLRERDDAEDAWRQWLPSDAGVASVQSVQSTPAAEPPSSWAPIRLGATMRGLADGTLSIPRPTIGNVVGVDLGLFYVERVNALVGKGGDGKTWIGQTVTAQAITEGRCVWWIDFEDSPLGIAGRLADLGLDPDLVDRHLRYVQPSEAMDLVTRGRVVDAIAADRAELVVIDSTGEWMGMQGTKPNDDAEVTAWFQLYARPLAAAGPAVVIIDHFPHNAEGRNSGGGSIRKYNAVNGASYTVVPLAEFGRERIGRNRLVVGKDRNGHRVRGMVAAELTLDATVKPYVATFAPPVAHPTDEGPLAGEKPAVRRVWSALEQSDGATVHELGDLVAKDGTTGTGLKSRTIQDALARLRALEMADHDDAGGAFRWFVRMTPSKGEGNDR